MTLFVIIFMLLLVAPDIYIWWMFVRESGSALLNIVWWLPAAAALAAAVAWTAGLHADWLLKLFFAILLCLALPKLLFVLFSVVGSLAGVLLPAAASVIRLAGAAAAVVLAFCCVYGFTAGPKRLEVRNTAIRSPRLPSQFDGYRIVHISDLHVGTFGNDTTFLQRLVERVNGLDADLVVFTGDLVNSSPDELRPNMRVLSGLRGRDGVWSVLGNHDYCEYARYDRPDGAARNCARLVAAQYEMGWHLLLNEHGLIERDGAAIAVAGVENDGRPPFPSRGNLRKAKEGVGDSLFTVLLSHDPTHWRREVLPAEAADVTLSGHTHAMQFELFGMSPSALSYSEWGGLYGEGGRWLYVSKGTGGTAPFRFGAWPEITVVTLECEK